MTIIIGTADFRLVLDRERRESREREREGGGILEGMDGGKRSVDCRCAGRDAKDKMTISQIMLRFRPIAPKPVTAESTERSILSMDGRLRSKRRKRKYVRAKEEEVTRCNLRMNDDKGWLDLDRTVAMLKVSSGNEFVVTDPVRKVPDWIRFDVSGTGNNKNNIISNRITPAPLFSSSSDLHDVDLAMAVQRGKVVESWITMESVTGTCEVGRRLGCTDEEIRKNLEKDSCPGFISNCYDEVQWVNLAYRRIGDPNPNGGGPPPDVVVWLRVKVEKSTLLKYWPAFSCTVRVAYQLLEKKTQMTVPCDVWKMDFGGFAWRLDVEAALSLGRLN